MCKAATDPDAVKCCLNYWGPGHYDIMWHWELAGELAPAPPTRAFEEKSKSLPAPVSLSAPLTSTPQPSDLTIQARVCPCSCDAHACMALNPLE